MIYLKEELYQLVKNDSAIFDFIQEHALDGLSYSNISAPDLNWVNPALQTLLKNDLPPADSVALDPFIVDFFPLIKTAKGEIDTQEVTFKCTNGQIVKTTCKLHFIYDNNDEVYAVLKAYKKAKNTSEQHDIQEIKEHFELLQKKEAFLDECNKAANIGYWEVDTLSNTLYWSKITKAIHETDLDYTPTVDLALSFYKDGKSKSIAEAAVKGALTEGKGFSCELQLLSAKGNIKWVKSIGNSSFSNGICTKVSGTFQDITDLKESNIAVTIEKEKLLSVLKGSNIGTWEWNIQTNETDHSEMWTEILGYTLAELQPITTQKWEQLVHPDDVEFSKLKISEYFDRKSEYYEAE